MIPNSYSLHVKQKSNPARPPRLALALASLLAAVAVAGCSGSGAGNPASRLSTEQAKAPIPGAPPQLAAIRSQASQLLGGGKDAFDARLAQLQGTPLVVNKWASWCGPCRLEFPWFQSLAQKRGGQIAFLGVDGNDSDGAAKGFLEELPLPYPSYTDPHLEIAQELGGPPHAFPTTDFYDRTGKMVFSHPGVYPSEQALIADVQKYEG